MYIFVSVLLVAARESAAEGPEEALGDVAMSLEGGLEACRCAGKIRHHPAQRLEGKGKVRKSGCGNCWPD